MKRVVLFSLVLILGLIIGISEVLLPAYYSQQVEAGLREQLQDVKALDVQISSRPALLLLTGRIQKGSVSAREMRLQEGEVQDLQIEEVEAAYKDLVFVNTPEGAKAISGTNTYFRAKLRESDLNQYLNQRYSAFQEIKLELQDGVVSLAVQVSLFNTQISLKIAGYFEIINYQTIRFIPEDLEVVNVKLPSVIVERLVEQSQFEVKLGEYPLPLELEELRIEDEALLILGGTQLTKRLDGVSKMR